MNSVGHSANKPQKHITSAGNDIFKMLLSLKAAAGIKKLQQFLISGEKITNENYSAWKNNILAEVISEKNIPARFPKSPLWILSDELFQQIDLLGTHESLLLARLPEIPPADLNQAPVGLEIIAPLGDPSNLGALARSAWSLGVKKIILTEDAAHPFHPKALKASSGALLQMQIERTKSFPEISFPPGSFPWALDLNGENLHRWKAPQHLRLLIGEEGPGLNRLSPESKKNIKRLTVPMKNLESLNAMVAASLAIYEWAKQNSAD